MRILIDLQGAQTGSRFRGIGRYTLSMAKAIVKEAGRKHEVLIALNGLLPETIEPLKKEFCSLLADKDIKIWYAPGPIRDDNPLNGTRRKAAELIREAFFKSLEPDVVFIPSLFEGNDHDAATSIGSFDKSTPVVAAIHDITPLVNYNMILMTYPLLKENYFRKLDYLKNASAWLSVSKYSAMDAIKNIGLDERAIYVTYEGFESIFKKMNVNEDIKKNIKAKFGIERDFLLYTGVVYDQKNIPRLIEAYSKLSQNLHLTYQLVFAGNITDDDANQIILIAERCRLNKKDIVFTGHVTDEELLLLYNLCSVFVFPSLYEGFGLPPLEAMACGAPVIASNSTSLPEVIGNGEALFDPFSTDAIAEKITRVLTDENFRNELSRSGIERAKRFSWETSAKKAMEVFEKFDNIKTTVSAGDFKIEETGIFKKKHHRILVIKLDHMGDFILAIPALTKLKAKYPYSRIDIMVGSWNRPIAEQLGIFTDIYEFDYFKKKSAVSPSYLEDELGALLNRIGFYDMAVDLRRHGDTRFILANANCALKVGYQTHDKAIDAKLDVIIPHELDRALSVTELNKKSISVQMTDIIDSLPADVSDYITLPEMGTMGQENSLKGLKSMEVAVFPFAGSDAREWGEDNFEKLVKMLCREERIDAVNIYFSNNDERTRLKLDNAEKLRIHVGLSFLELINSLKKNLVCISNTSFGAHMSSYLGLYSLMICGGTVPVREWFPVYGRSFAIYKDMQCSPCYIKKKEDCRFGLACFEGITPEKISDIAISIITAFVNGVEPNIENTAGINDLFEYGGNKKLIDALIDKIGQVCDLGNDNDYLAELAVCLKDLFANK